MANAGTLGRHNPNRPNIGSKARNHNMPPGRRVRKGIGNTKYNRYKKHQDKVKEQRELGAAHIFQFIGLVVHPEFHLPPRLDEKDPVDYDLCRKAHASLRHTIRSLAEYFNTTLDEIRFIIKQ